MVANAVGLANQAVDTAGATPKLMAIHSMNTKFNRMKRSVAWIVDAKSPRFTGVCAQWAAFDRLRSDKLCPLHERRLLAETRRRTQSDDALINIVDECCV